MNKPERIQKRLHLQTDTLRQLSDEELGEAKGATTPVTVVLSVVGVATSVASVTIHTGPTGTTM